MPALCIYTCVNLKLQIHSTASEWYWFGYVVIMWKIIGELENCDANIFFYSFSTLTSSNLTKNTKLKHLNSLFLWLLAYLPFAQLINCKLLHLYYIFSMRHDLCLLSHHTLLPIFCRFYLVHTIIPYNEQQKL